MTLRGAAGVCRGGTTVARRGLVGIGVCMVVSPLREAGDVAVRSLTQPVSDAFDLLRTGHRRHRFGDRRIGWQVVNLDVDGRRLRYRVTDNVASSCPAIPRRSGP